MASIRPCCSAIPCSSISSSVCFRSPSRLASSPALGPGAGVLRDSSLILQAKTSVVPAPQPSNQSSCVQMSAASTAALPPPPSALGCLRVRESASPRVRGPRRPSAVARRLASIVMAFCMCLWSASIKKGKKRGKGKKKRRGKRRGKRKKRKGEKGLSVPCCPLSGKATSEFTYYLPCRLDYLGDFTTTLVYSMLEGSRFAAHRGLHQHSCFYLCTLLNRPTQVVDRDPH